MDSTSASLLERMRQPDDAAAWERFVRLYTPLLVHWARKLGVPDAEVGDLVQEVFAILVKALPDFRFDPRQQFRGWLWTITKNKWLERLRQKAARREIAVEQLPDLATVDGVQAIDETEYRQFLVSRALRLMQTEFQQPIWRAFWECTTNDRPAAEVARELGLTVDAVYAAKSRVLRRLRQELAGLLD